MAGDKILVLGGTGPAGICLVRELLHRGFSTIVYARNPQKLPEEFFEMSLLEIVTGELSDTDALSAAVSKSRVVLSLLGPSVMSTAPRELYADFLRSLFHLMRQHGVRRLFCVATLSIYLPDDKASWMRSAGVTALQLLCPSPHSNIVAVGEAFRDEQATKDIDWTVFRIGGLPGGSDAVSWKRDREDGKTYVGPVAGPGWGMTQKRAALTRWLVDMAESGAPELVGQMPAVSRLSGS